MKKVSWLAPVALVLAAGTASATVPTTMNFTGRLTTSAGPVTSPVTVIFRICVDSSSSCTSPLWTETHAAVTPVNGIVYVELGATTALDEALFTGVPRYLEIIVNAETLTPRMKINSVPYATRAGVADALGTLVETDMVTGVTGSNGVGATKTGNNVAVSLVNCGSNQIYKMNGTSGFTCQNDADTAPTGTAPITVASNAVSLATCGANQIYKMVSGAWTCSDLPTAPTGTAPIAVSGSNVVSLTVCGANQYYHYNGSSWACIADPTAPTGTAPIAVSGSNVVSLTVCGANQYYHYNGSTWACINDPTAPTGTAPIAVSGTNVVSLATCPTPGQIYKMVSGAWSCQADNDTTYSAGSGISITTGTIAADGTIPRLAGNQSFSGINAFSNTSNTFAGDGSGLTALSAANISTGTLAIARGGTNAGTVGAAGTVAYSSGTAYAFNTAGSAGQVLTSGGAAAPSWTTPAQYVLNATNTTLTRSGTGVTADPYTLGVNTGVIQNRVSGTCSVGSSIRTINADGSVVCDLAPRTVTTEVMGFASSVTLTTSTQTLLLSLAVPGSPGGYVSLVGHVFLERSAATDSQYSIEIHIGTCAGTLIGQAYARMANTTNAFDDVDVPVIGHTTGITAATTFVLCGNLFTGVSTSAYMRGLTANW